MWAALHIVYKYTFDGEEISQEFLREISHDAGAHEKGFDALRGRVWCVITRWDVVTAAGAEASFDTLDAFLHYAHAARISYFFVWDGVRDLSSIQYAVMTARRDSGIFKRVSLDTQKDEKTGQYKKVTGNAFAELSGELGQRYSFSIWSFERRTRAEGGDRHERTHGIDIYALRNFFPVPWREVARSFAGGEEVEESAGALREVLLRFNSLCEELTGTPFFGERKPAAMTAGGLAKKELLRFIGRSDDPRAAARAYRKAHPMPKELDAELRDGKLLRGGILWANRRFCNAPLHGVRKYDANSEYLYVASNMPDLHGRAVVVPAEEFFARREGYVYIAVFSVFNMRVKKGFPAVFQNPFTGSHAGAVHISEKFMIFDIELDELTRFYNMGECVLDYCIRFPAENTDSYKSFASKWYGEKQTAREHGDAARAMFAKLFINSALGKLSQRADFPTVWHEIDACALLDLRADMTNKSDSGAGLLSVAQGAYMVAAARVYIMQAIRRVGGELPAETVIFCATDSIATFKEMPADMIGTGLGAFKDEGGAPSVESVYADTAAYYNIFPDRVDFHARGIPFDAFAREVCDAWGVASLDEVGAGGLCDAFLSGVAFPCPILANVHGGRAVLYTWKTINARRISVKSGVKPRREVFDGVDMVEA